MNTVVFIMSFQTYRFHKNDSHASHHPFDKHVFGSYCVPGQEVTV